MIVATSRIRVIAGDAEALAELHRERLRLADDALGCRGIEVLRSLERPDEFVVYLRWTDRDACDRYRSGSAFREAHQRIREAPRGLKVERPEGGVQLYEILS